MKLEDFKKIPRFANCTDEAAVMSILGETARKADFKNGLTALKAMKPKKLLKDKFENQELQAGESPWEKRQKEIRENIRK